MLSRIQYLHQRSFVHRDIKPDNFVFGLGANSNVLYLIDLGLAKQYRELTTFQHFGWTDDCGLTGTVRYVSVNVHLGLDQSCRDDLESIGYLLISFLVKKLPWDRHGPKMTRAEKSAFISDQKMKTSLDTLCEGVPSEFRQYMELVRGLRFDERPNYAHLRSLFVNLMVRENIAYDYGFDWVARKRTRIEAILSGEMDSSTVIARVGRDIANGGNIDSNIVNPLPLFAAIQDGARFLARSRLHAEPPSEEKREKPKIRELRSDYPVFPVKLEFAPL
jgi:serine/threonine protein kinase